MLRMKSCPECRLATNTDAPNCDCGHTFAPIDRVEDWGEHYERVLDGETDVPHPNFPNKGAHWLPCSASKVVTYREWTLRRVGDRNSGNIKDWTVDEIPVKRPSRSLGRKWVAYIPSKEQEVHLPTLMSHITLVLGPITPRDFDNHIDQIDFGASSNSPLYSFT